MALFDLLDQLREADLGGFVPDPRDVCCVTAPGYDRDARVRSQVVSELAEAQSFLRPIVRPIGGILAFLAGHQTGSNHPDEAVLIPLDVEGEVGVGIEAETLAEIDWA